MSQHHHPRKRFGQHFLRDVYILEKIAETIAPKTDEHLIEIGPGEGVLTELLLPHVQHLDVVEIDRDLVSLLKERFAYNPKITIHQADALDFNFATLQRKQKLRIVGNLPYNISTPILFHLFEQLPSIQDMFFLLQKEVVERLTAAVGDSNYGRLSVMSQYYCQNELLFYVGPEAFEPPPKVDSAFMRLLPFDHRPHTATDIVTLSKVVQQAFNYRRKTIANSFKPLVGVSTLQQLGIDPQLRPQELSVADYVRISNAITVE